MGIKKLNKFINEKNLINEYPNLEIYLMYNKKPGKNAVIAIDFWLYAYKFTYSYGNMIIGFWNQAINFLAHRVIPLYVFDGAPPNEKETILSMRQKKKKNIEIKLKEVCEAIESDEVNDIRKLEAEKKRLEKSLVKITKQDILTIKQLFDTLNVPHMTANGEADALCAKLYKEGVITACLSDDMDMLVFGCEKTIKFSEGKLIEFNLTKILDELELIHDEFIDMCILFGCDYIRTCNKLNYIDAYELIKEHKTIKNIFDEANHDVLNYENEKCKMLLNEHEHVHELFVNMCDSEEIEVSNNISITKKIGIIDIIGFLTIRCPDILKYKGNKIKNSIDYINNHISKNCMNVQNTN